MPITNDALEKIKALSRAYGKQLPAKINEFKELWVEAKLHLNTEKLSQVTLYAHTLSGTAGTYGYQMISETAKRIEKILRKQKLCLSLQNITEIDTILNTMTQLSTQPPDSEMQSKINLKQIINNGDFHSIYVLDKEKDVVSQQMESIEQFNYKLKFFDDLVQFLQAVYDDSPDMIVVNIKFADQIPREATKRFREEIILTVFFGEQDDLQARLQTVRHGGQAYLVQPFDRDILLRIFDNLFQAKTLQNEKVLIVDDSEFLANYYATLLNHAGMATDVLVDPKQFLMKLTEFQPDLILMDVNMPYCNGIELAQIVHQQENLSGIPIIFLSSISEKNRQLEALSYAGDDFLTKPVDPKHLLATIHNRLMRSRMLRSRMMRDSLTNLYNHTLIHHQLERELVVAERYQQDLCVALIDIDHFKQVNDQYGHQAGDKVLKDLSLFLRKNLRKSDLIGRYGGEEFLIILPKTNLKDGFKLIDNLRRNFAEITHTLDKYKIQVTLSGGITSYPMIKASADLIRAADNALYQAKEEGRNKIISTSFDSQ